ncbi:MAG TPA: phosphate acetyltransferase [Euzebyales bacterium]|nr:phosphate acetyltransferase [Euzebyales bacterium]
MANNLYLASLEPGSGRSLVTLGLMDLLSRRTGGVGYFRPVIPSSQRLDPRIALVVGRYRVDLGAEEMYAYTAPQVEHMLAEGRRDEVFSGILHAYKAIERRCGFVLCDGTDFTGVTAAFEFDFNVAVANHLGAPVLALVNGHQRSADDIVAGVQVAAESLRAEGAVVAATMVNRVPRGMLELTREALMSAEAVASADVDGQSPLWVIPEDPRLSMPTMAEIGDALGASDVNGRPLDAEQEVSTFKVAAMSVPNFLDHVSDGALIITSGDRPDVILATLVSRLTPSMPTVAGMVLTGGLPIAPQVERLLTDTPLPILQVDTDTYTTASRVGAVRGVIRPDNERKIATALGLFERHVDVDALADRIEVTRSDRVTPLMFEYELIERARSVRKRIVLPEGSDDRILQAAQLLLRRDVVDLVLLGDVDQVRARIDALGLDLGGTPVIDPTTAPERDDYAGRYLELRRHKGITAEQAYDTMADLSYFGTMMVHTGAVDGMVSGAAHTTGHTIRPAFEFIKTRPSTLVVSSVFFMLLADRVLVYGDCAVNPNPTAEQLADIAICSAETAAEFGVEPLVAMLSYSTGTSGAGEDVERVREATAIARRRRPDLKIEGPIQYDASVDPSVAKAKLPGSEVAGHATVFIFPDLNTGNNTYKAVQRSAGALAIGPVLQGLNKPVNDLSRGCTVPDIVNTVAITAVQAQDARSAAVEPGPRARASAGEPAGGDLPEAQE